MIPGQVDIQVLIQLSINMGGAENRGLTCESRDMISRYETMHHLTDLSFGILS